MSPCFFIFGFGYTAEYLTPRLLELNFRVMGTTRNKEKTLQNSALGYELIEFSEEHVKKYLPYATHILVSTPPLDATGDPVLEHFSELIKKHASHIEWMGYLSSTGVYGNHDGAWVDETSASLSAGKKGLLRLDAENAWMTLAQEHQIPLHIFRLAGIYGPKRNALEHVLAGKQRSIYKEGHFFSRIHVEDSAAIICASIQRPNLFSIYNVADDEPTPSYVMDAYATSLLNRPPLPLIPYEEAALSVMEKEFYANNRRVSNTKVKQELSIKLTYPSYKEGLKHVL